MKTGSIGFPYIFKRFGPQFWYFMVVPLFFIIFILIYRPEGICAFIDGGTGAFEFNLSILFLILFVCLLVFRLLFYMLRHSMSINWWWYIVWCVGEIFLTALIASYFVYRVSGERLQFFETIAHCEAMFFLICALPYVIFTLALTNYSRIKFSANSDSSTLVRFRDENKNLKLVVSAASVLYIQAEENYVRIHYLEGETHKEYLMRSTMKSIEELVLRHGMMRCHRSYFVNPDHIEVLRKEKDGVFLAQLSALDGVSVPVSRKYYDEIAKVMA